MTTNAPRSRAGEQVAQLTHEVRLALRALRCTPAFTLSVAVTLTVVIGMSTAVFSVVNAVLLRPLSYPSPERLVWLSTYDNNAREEIVPRSDFRTWRREATRSFDRMVAYRTTDLTLATTNGAVQARVAFVSSDFWSVVGPVLMMGRPTMEGQDAGIVLSHGLFVRQFGSDSSIVGRSITVDGQPFTVTGVLSPPDSAFYWCLHQHVPRTSRMLKPTRPSTRPHKTCNAAEDEPSMSSAGCAKGCHWIKLALTSKQREHESRRRIRCGFWTGCRWKWCHSRTSSSVLRERCSGFSLQALVWCSSSGASTSPIFRSHA